MEQKVKSETKTETGTVKEVKKPSKFKKIEKATVKS